MSANRSTGAQRLRYADAAKGLGMLMIMWGHLSPLYDPVSAWCAAPKIAVFYLISGMLLGRKAERQEMTGTRADLVQHAKKRLRTLGIPYLVYSVLILLFHAATGLLRHRNPAAVAGTELWETVTLRGISTLWFLPTLFFAELIWIGLLCGRRKHQLTFLAGIPFLCWGMAALRAAGNGLPFWADAPFLTIAKSISAAWFVAAGAGANRLLRHSVPRVHAVCGLLAAAVLSVLLPVLNAGVDFNYLQLGRIPLLYFLNGMLSGMLMIVLLRLAEQKFRMKLLCLIGRNSLFIMATHLPFGFCKILNAAADAVRPCPAFSGGFLLRIAVLLCLLLAAEALLIAGMHRLRRAAEQRPQQIWTSLLRYLS